MQTNSSLDSDWLTIREALLPLGALFSGESSLRYHLNNRETNGLAGRHGRRPQVAAGVLLANPPRIERWVLAELVHRDVA
jgi:hypothetical protein